MSVCIRMRILRSSLAKLRFDSVVGAGTNQTGYQVRESVRESGWPGAGYAAGYRWKQ